LAGGEGAKTGLCRAPNIWDFQRAGLPFVFNKFNPPVIDGGRIFVPDYAGGVGLAR
jgi:hypothetical protein